MDLTWEEYLDFINHLFLDKFRNMDKEGSTVDALTVIE